MCPNVLQTIPQRRSLPLVPGRDSPFTTSAAARFDLGTTPGECEFCQHGSMEGPMSWRRRVGHEQPLAERLALEAIKLKETAKRLKPGSQRQTLLRKAREAEIAASITAWISSPGLKPPE